MTDASQLIRERLGVTVERMTPLSGGDICSAWKCVLDDGRTVFAKEHPDGALMFEAEAHGLRWLAESSTIEVPDVLAVSARALVLSYVEPGSPTPESDERLGRDLAALHRSNPGAFGWGRPGILATLSQDNEREPDWPTFYGHRRLRPLVRLCIERGRLPPASAHELDALLAVLPDRLGPPEPPARLHGDLWSGNAMTRRDGVPVVFDPAPYGGHREIDLAMMQLFGGFEPRVYDAYDEVYPRAPGHDERTELMQLYPMLVHVALFGGHYAAAALGIFRRYS